MRNISTAEESSFPFCCQAFVFLCSSSLSCFPIFAKSHKNQFSKAYCLRTVLRHRLEAERVVSCFLFWGFQDVAVKVNEKDFSDSREILLTAIFSPHFLYGPATNITENFAQRSEMVYSLNYFRLNPV